VQLVLVIDKTSDDQFSRVICWQWSSPRQHNVFPLRTDGDGDRHDDDDSNDNDDDDDDIHQKSTCQVSFKEET